VSPSFSISAFNCHAFKHPLLPIEMSYQSQSKFIDDAAEMDTSMLEQVIDLTGSSVGDSNSADVAEAKELARV